MINNIKVFLLYTLSFGFVHNLFKIDSLKSLFDTNSFNDIQTIMKNGSMGGYLNYTEYLNIADIIKKEFSSIIVVDSIGKTNENRDIPLFKFFRDKDTASILFTGMHHAREPVSFLMNLNIILKILYEIHKGNTLMLELVKSRNIFFIPILNIDGYIANNKYFEDNNSFGMIRKNRNNAKIFSSCSIADNGVDLNRNYDYHFGENDIGSSSNPCQEDFRGESAFSEPETKAIKDLIEENNIKIAYNYHSFGNFLITPFNYDSDENNNLKTKFDEFYKLYKEFYQEGLFPFNDIMGNGKATVGYEANGEASDWMLGAKKILSFSPELGIYHIGSEYGYESFYPPIDKAFNIINSNLDSAFYGIQRVGYFVKAFALKNYFKKCKYNPGIFSNVSCNSTFLEFRSIIDVKNIGYGKLYNQMKLELNFEHTYIEKIKILINNKIIIDKEYTNTNSTQYEKTFFNISHLEYNQSIPLEIIYHIRNTSINLTNFEFSFKRNNSTVLGISNVVFNNPLLIVNKNDYELVYNDEDLISSNFDITTLKYIFYFLIIIIIITYLLTIQAVRDFILSKIKFLRNIKVTKTIVTDRNRSVSYDNL